MIKKIITIPLMLSFFSCAELEPQKILVKEIPFPHRNIEENVSEEIVLKRESGINIWSDYEGLRKCNNPGICTKTLFNEHQSIFMMYFPKKSSIGKTAYVEIRNMFNGQGSISERGKIKEGEPVYVYTPAWALIEKFGYGMYEVNFYSGKDEKHLSRLDSSGFNIVEDIKKSYERSKK